MFEIMYDGDYPTATVDADRFVEDPSSPFVAFYKGGHTVLVAKVAHVVSITKVGA